MSVSTKAATAGVSAATADKLVNLFNWEVSSPPLLHEIAKLTPETGHNTQTRLSFALVESIRAFHKFGHLCSDIDPLGLSPSVGHLPAGRATVPSVQSAVDLAEVLERFNLKESDLDTPFEQDVDLNCGGFLGSRKSVKGETLRGILTELNKMYSGKINVEFAHLADPNKVRFFVEAMEGTQRSKFYPTNAEKKQLLRRVTEAQCFESFLQKKAPTTKRFGIDGLDSGISFLQTVTAKSGAEHCLLAMAHRGRLNVLGNVFKKPYKALMREFKGSVGFGGEEYGNYGDVKYHLGVEHKKVNELTGQEQRFSLLCNPSHLEAANSLLLGRSRAVIDRLADDENIPAEDARQKVLPIVVHGDQAVAGQGVVYETFQMMSLEGYDVGGTVHLVLNNQIGFTTSNKDGMSTRYCSDIAKAFDVPVIHANADDLASVEMAARLAAAYRKQFASDVFVDIVGYRRNGHNEQDMPMFTQPEMYKAINSRKPVADLTAEKYIEEGIVTAAEFEGFRTKAMEHLEVEYKEAEKGEVENHSYAALWDNMATPSDYRPAPKTGLPVTELKALLKRIASLPESFTAHPNIKKIFDARLKAASDGKGIDFGTAESLAFGSLLKEGFNVRLAGQDSKRGTFSHRHSTVHDQLNFNAYTPLTSIRPENPFSYQVVNSLLSEYAALGFELGYANHHPDTLTIWEAQFGDFANGAQIVIDQMLCSQEVKWGQQSGLVMYLPHGYDGMGPEHSSARMERFLQLCDNREDVISPSYFDPSKRKQVQTSNMQIVVPTTASNLYHVLRRQIMRGFRKPLVVFQSKRLLKSKDSLSTMSELDVGTHFMPFYGDDVKDKSKVERLILCSGQVYFDFAKKRKQTKNESVAIARVEQLCPLPFAEMKAELDKYPNLRSVVWGQEEPMNAGAWSYMNPRIATLLRFTGLDKKLGAPIYVGRDICASTAVGCAKIHAAELQKILREAFSIDMTTHSPSEYFTVSGKNVTSGPSIPAGDQYHALQSL